MLLVTGPSRMVVDNCVWLRRGLVLSLSVAFLVIVSKSFSQLFAKRISTAQVIERVFEATSSLKLVFI